MFQILILKPRRRGTSPTAWTMCSLCRQLDDVQPVQTAGRCVACADSWTMCNLCRQLDNVQHLLCRQLDDVHHFLCRQLDDVQPKKELIKGNRNMGRRRQRGAAFKPMRRRSCHEQTPGSRRTHIDMSRPQRSNDISTAWKYNSKE